MDVSAVAVEGIGRGHGGGPGEHDPSSDAVAERLGRSRHHVAVRCLLRHGRGRSGHLYARREHHAWPIHDGPLNAQPALRVGALLLDGVLQVGGPVDFRDLGGGHGEGSRQHALRVEARDGLRLRGRARWRNVSPPGQDKQNMSYAYSLRFAEHIRGTSLRNLQGRDYDH